MKNKYASEVSVYYRTVQRSDVVPVVATVVVVVELNRRKSVLTVGLVVSRKWRTNGWPARCPL